MGDILRLHEFLFKFSMYKFFQFARPMLGVVKGKSKTCQDAETLLTNSRLYC